MGFLRRLARNWQLKTLAVALGVLLWTVISADQVTTTDWLTVPLEVRVSDPNYQTLPANIPTEVEVRLSGPARDLFGFVLRRPPYVLTVSGIENQVETRILEPRMLQIPGQMQIQAIEVRPASLRLEFARVGMKRVPVRAQITSSLGDNWAVVDTLRGEPSVVEVSGPIERLANVSEVVTLPLELTPSDTLIDRTLALDTTGLAGLRLSTRTVRITGRVDRMAERTLAGMLVDAGPGVNIAPDRVNVTLRGAGSAVRAIVPGALRVVMAIDSVPAQLPPDGIVVPLRLQGVGPGLEVVLSPGQIRLLPIETATDTLPGGEPGPRDTLPSGSRPDAE